MNRKRTPLFLLWLSALLLLRLSAIAHGPFDNSSQLILHEDSLELAVTLGMDGAKQFLAKAGLSGPEIVSALTPRPSSSQPLSPNLAAQCFEVTADGAPLAAGAVKVISDGLEATFTLSYSRPHAASLSLRARYFDGIEEMKRGPFVATDENGRNLGSAVFSRSESSARIALATPATPPAASAAESLKAAPTPSPVIISSNEINQPRASTGEKRAHLPTVCWTALIALAAAGSWIAVRKLSGSR